MIDTKDLDYSNIKLNLTEIDIIRELARRDLRHFAALIYPSNVLEPFHDCYYQVLNRFAFGEIKNLIITIPPQHGKSEGSSRLLPSFMLGINPDLRISIASYNATFARKFNRSIQRIIDSDEYRGIFPQTTLWSENVRSAGRWLRNTDEFEIVGRLGSLLAVGRGGPLMGNPYDVEIFDDLYKDASEGNSPIIRDSVIEWYHSSPEKRKHNDTQSLIVFTRWHEEDLIGYIEENEVVIEASSHQEIDEAIKQYGKDVWIKVNYEAIKESDKTEFDQREYGQALWPDRHSLEKHLKERAKQPHMFECMNQGKPAESIGRLYGPFRTYDKLPPTIKKGNYTDTADMGDDYLFSVCYEVGADGQIYVVDLVYTQDPMETTEVMVPKMINDNGTRETNIESNSGGRGFARRVEEGVYAYCVVNWFHQSDNKESRILTNAAEVNKILFPTGWDEKWPLFYSHLTGFKRLFRANKYDDGPDGLTGIIEKEILTNSYRLYG